MLVSVAVAGDWDPAEEWRRRENRRNRCRNPLGAENGG